MVAILAAPHAEAVLQLLPHGVVVVAPDWRVLLANPEATRLLGSGSGSGGGTLWERCPDLENTAFASGFRYAMADRTELLTESALPSVGWCQARALPMPDGSLLISLRQVHGHALESGQAMQALLIGEIGDALTREESLSAALQRCAVSMTRHLEAAISRIWVTDAADEYLDLTAHAGLDMPETEARLALGQHAIGRIGETGEPYLTNDVMTDTHVGATPWIRSQRLISFAGYPLRVEDRVVGVMAMYSRRPIDHDMLNSLSTIASAIALGIARKGADAARRRVEAHNAQLFSEARTLIAALEKSNAELDQFAYVASHDLKAPLRGIANLSQWIEDDLGERLDEKTREHLTLLRGRVMRLENLIAGILAYSRAGRDRDPRPVVVPLDQLVREVWELLAPPATARLVVTTLPRLTGMRVQLQQIMLNLVSNALKYNLDRELTITVSARRDGACWEIAVDDTGVGIPPEFRERIWGLFQTLERRDKVESTGIGLAVVRKIVEANGGRTWVEATPAGGARFLFTWPAQPEGAPHA